MFKLKLSSIVISAVTMTSVCYAQPFGTPTAPAKSNNIMSAIPQPQTSMSASDFKSQVKTMNQQTQSDLSKQAADMLSKQPMKPLPAAPNQSPNQSTSSKNSNDAASSTDAPKTVVTPPPAKNADADTQQDSPDTYSVQQQPPAPAPVQQQSNAPTTTTAPSSQSKPYSGFGNGGSTGTSGSGASQSSGGWGIKY